MVREANLIQVRRGRGVKEAAVEEREREGIADGLCRIGQLRRRYGAAAFVNEAEQAPEAVVEVETLTGPWRTELHELEVAERLQAVAFEIRLIADRHVAQLRP